ncbi:MAG: hypothetical protein HYV16_00945 [Gammaproteobacteria bacterium]|nr:hypothetical protein [Gammaproteobacteria bacterium]
MNGESIPPPVQVADLLPIRVNSAQQYWGSFVRVDGVSSAGDQVHLRVYLCDWQLFQRGQLVASSNADISNNKIGLNSLAGVLIEKIAIPDKAHVKLTCSEGVVLQLDANFYEYDEGDILLYFYLPSRSISYNPTSGFLSEIEGIEKIDGASDIDP